MSSKKKFKQRYSQNADSNGSPMKDLEADIETYTNEEEAAEPEEFSQPETAAEEYAPEEPAEAAPEEAPAEEPEDAPEETPAEESILEEEPQEEVNSGFIFMGATAPQAEEAGEEEKLDEEKAKAPEEEKTGEENAEESPAKSIPRFTPFVYAVTLLGVFAICFLFYFLHLRQEPANATKAFLSSIQSLDFDQMQSLLVNQDLGALEDADLSNAIYHDFFTDVNEHMTFDISRIDFGLGRSDAKVTARIHHVDGTELYEKVLNDFLLDIVNTAFSGETYAQEETEGKLAVLLHDTYDNLPLRYTDTEISYPLEKTEEGWKILALDDTTVKVMSANFKSIQEEIQNLLSGGAETRQAADAEEGSTDKSVFSLTPTDVISITTGEYEIKFDRFAISEDISGKPCLLYYYTYKNLSDEPSSAINDLELKVFQDGKELSVGSPNDYEAALENYYNQVEPGQTLTICQAFALPEVSNVSVQVTDSFGDSNTQVLRIQ